jgi:AcrR family transcriptional regulator
VVEESIVPPRQARTRASWDRVLQEGVALLESGGYDALTIGALCERSGVTPPTIYARAGSKEQLLLAIYERAMQRIVRDERLDPADGSWAAMEPAELVRAAVTQVARIWLDNAALLRPIVHRSAADAEIRRRGSAYSRDLAARFRAVLLTHGHALGPDAEAAADVCFRLVYAALVQRVMYGADFESDLPLDGTSFTTALGDAAVRYLRLEEGIDPLRLPKETP